MSILAHAGHGVTDGHSLLHYLIEPAHLPFTVAAAVVVLAVFGWAIAKRRKA